MRQGGAGQVARDLAQIGGHDLVDDTDGAGLLGKNHLAHHSVDVGVGRGSATIWTCDLTKQYVAINGDYRS